MSRVEGPLIDCPCRRYAARITVFSSGRSQGKRRGPGGSVIEIRIRARCRLCLLVLISDRRDADCRAHNAHEQQLPHDQSPGKHPTPSRRDTCANMRVRSVGGATDERPLCGDYNVLPASWRCRAMLPAARARSVFTAPLNWAPSSRAKRLAITLASTVALGPMSTLSAVM